MPENEKEQPKNQTPEEIATKEKEAEDKAREAVEGLPDESPGEVDAEKLKADAESEKAETAERIKTIEAEKENLERRLKDNQEYISRTRNVEKSQVDAAKPAKTMEDYFSELGTVFRDDPEAGFLKFARDVTFDRDLGEQSRQKEIVDVEDRAFKRMLKLDPEKAKVFQDVEQLTKDRPDLENFTYEQKLEHLSLKTAKAEQEKSKSREQIEREREISSDVGGSPYQRKAGRIPSWANDPEVLANAKDRFESKKEMVDWADPVKAQAMGQKMRQAE